MVVPLLMANPTDNLVAGLKKALLSGPAAPGGLANTGPQITQYLNALNAALAKGRYVEAEQLLGNLRAGPAGANPAAGSYIDQLIMEIHSLADAANAERDQALEEIVDDTCAKFSTNAKVEDFDPLFKRLAGLAPAAGQYNDPNAQKIEMVRSFVSRVQDYLQQSSHGNTEQAANALNEIIQISGRLPAVSRSKLLALQDEIGARQAARNAALAAQLEDLRKNVITVVDSAKSAADFDAVLADLAKPPAADPYRGNGSAGNLFNQFESLRRFTHRWQDYFSQLESGNTNAAQNALRELANDGSSEAFYPRSRILARLNGKLTMGSDPDLVGAIVTPAELTLDTLDKLARQSAARRSGGGVSGGVDPGMDEVANESARLRAAASQLKLGNPQAALSLPRTSNFLSHSGDYEFAFARVQQALIVQALAVSLAAPAELKPADNETPASFLQRVLRYGRDKADWQLVYRALEVSQTMGLQGGGFSDYAGYRIFFIGLNQERAGDWQAAVRSYQSSLRTVGPNLPVDEIGKRLKTLKEAHPKEYEAAQGQAETSSIDLRGVIPVGAMPNRGNPAGYVAVRDPQTGTIIGFRPPGSQADSLPAPPPAEPAKKQGTEPEKIPAPAGAEARKP